MKTSHDAWVYFAGNSFDFTTEVVEVNVGPLSDEVFNIPDGYERVDDFREVAGL